MATGLHHRRSSPRPALVTRHAARQPLYLLADSQLLFWKRHKRPLLEAAVDRLARDAPLCAAYIGASNGDRREFYEIFEAAMDAIGVTDRRMIGSSFGSGERAFLGRARVIVLAGGDVRAGWDTMASTGMTNAILARHADGAVLVGISAGAVQLGRCEPTPDATATAMFQLAPMVVDTHDERADWAGLARTVAALGETGLGIPSGGGVVVHPQGGLQALRRPAHEFRLEGSRVVHTLLPAE